MKIMVVGKGPASRSLMRSVREIGDVEQVWWISSGEEAVSAYRRLEPDLIFIDIIQDGMCGIESARAIREQDKNIKIVLVSESFRQEFLAMARETELNGYLVRTNNPEILREVIFKVDHGKFRLFIH